MSIKTWFLTFLVSIGLSSPIPAVPEELIRGLLSDDFKEREKSERALLDWSQKDLSKSSREILKLSRTTDEPELRQRSLNVLKEISDLDYLKEGKGFLGITMQPATAKIPEVEEEVDAVRIVSIVRDGPAENFGLQVGDLIVSLNDKYFVEDDVLTEFSGAIGAMPPLAKVILGIKRGDDKLRKIEVILARHPGINLSVLPKNLHLLDEQARQLHFDKWLKNLEDN